MADVKKFEPFLPHSTEIRTFYGHLYTKPTCVDQGQPRCNTGDVPVNSSAASELLTGKTDSILKGAGLYSSIAATLWDGSQRCAYLRTREVFLLDLPGQLLTETQVIGS
ncbi:hypothetical protein PR048_005561 [Dryococelus australis]|uniref:Uncharacterized protein n=1 Tax=Dryococelus australis TaxID=614101 RepID=A0ABQ9I8H2_9NEOP|nr:hypothetical protein PR048_005561 [Dryococelus australis]